jgi:dynein light chain 4
MAEEGDNVLYGIGTLAEIKRKMQNRLIVKQTDMPDEMAGEVGDSIQSSIESGSIHSNMAEVASKMIKEELDKKYGPTWQCIIGEGYAFHITVQSGSYLQAYYNGNISCLVFKT